MYSARPDLLQLVREHAPNNEFYKKIVEVKSAEMVELTNLQWAGGYKTDYVAVDLNSRRYAPVKTGRVAKLSEGTALIAYSWAGSSKSVTVFIHRSTAAKFLKPQASVKSRLRLTNRQLAFLYCVRNPIYRMEAARLGYNFTSKEWEEERDRLIAGGYLDKAGDLTMMGRNVLPKTLLELT